MVSAFLSTAATVVYTATLYPGINRGLTLRTPIQYKTRKLLYSVNQVRTWLRSLR